MSGLIKAELIRLTKSKSMIVCIVLSIALGIAVALLYNYFWEQKGENIARSYALMRQYGMQQPGFDYATLGGVMRDNIKAGGDVYLDGRTVGRVISDIQGKSYRALQRSGWQQ